MKRDHGTRKLQLVRETLCTLQNDDLDDVHGGTATTIVAASRASSAACIRAATPAVRWTAQMVSRIATAASVAYSLVHQSEHCGPNRPAPPPQGRPPARTH